MWISADNEGVTDSQRCCVIESCTDDMFLYTDTEVSITRVPSSKSIGIFPLNLGILQKIRLLQKHVYDITQKLSKKYTTFTWLLKAANGSRDEV